MTHMLELADYDLSRQYTVLNNIKENMIRINEKIGKLVRKIETIKKEHSRIFNTKMYKNLN